MRTRSTNKNDSSFVMLDDDKKSVRRQDFDKYGHHIINTNSKDSTKSEKTYCDWVCQCVFTTPLNLLIAGCLLLFIVILIDGLTHSIGINDSLFGCIGGAINDARIGFSDWATKNSVFCVVVGLLNLFGLSILIVSQGKLSKGSSTKTDVSGRSRPVSVRRKPNQQKH